MESILIGFMWALGIAIVAMIVLGGLVWVCEKLIKDGDFGKWMWGQDEE